MRSEVQILSPRPSVGIRIDVLLNPEEIVFGDIDGVVVIPKELDKKVISLALRKSGEGEY